MSTGPLWRERYCDCKRRAYSVRSWGTFEAGKVNVRVAVVTPVRQMQTFPLLQITLGVCFHENNLPSGAFSETELQYVCDTRR